MGKNCDINQVSTYVISESEKKYIYEKMYLLGILKDSMKIMDIEYVITISISVGIL